MAYRKEFRYSREDIVDYANKTAYIRLLKVTDQVHEGIRLVSNATGSWIFMKPAKEATEKLWNENEGWDGEYSCMLYKGVTNRGVVVTLELGCTPYDNDPEDRWEQ